MPLRDPCRAWRACLHRVWRHHRRCRPGPGLELRSYHGISHHRRAGTESGVIGVRSCRRCVSGASIGVNSTKPGWPANAQPFLAEYLPGLRQHVCTTTAISADGRWGCSCASRQRA
eukprot:3397136-Rhodomonas_salina.2